MNATQIFYLARAEEARLSAASATLANIRHRHLLAEQTWTGLAGRAGRVAASQAAREGEAHASPAAAATAYSEPA